jgi:predicted HTH transcriptional regulator
MKTTLEELCAWMNAAHENEHLEFKEAKNQYDTTKLFRYCIALANEGGGKLILGVANEMPRKVVGTRRFSIRRTFKAGFLTSSVFESKPRSSFIQTAAYSFFMCHLVLQVLPTTLRVLT